MCPEHPPVKPIKRMLFVDHPYLKTAFGYSPKKTKQNGNENVSNNLRLSFGDLIISIN
jgi:hypothetical protein